MNRFPIAFLAALFIPVFASAGTATISLTPARVMQGEPVMVKIAGATTTADITSVTFGGKSLGVFLYQGMPTAFVGIDINEKVGEHSVTAVLKNGEKLRAILIVDARPKVEAPLGIPEQLGGNTSASQAKLVATLQKDNASLANIRTGVKAFWTKAFSPPLATSTVTDSYGYSRQTGPYSIPHKGADFQAKVGTPVMAMNRGIVRVARTYRDYGKTIVVDHGLGLMTFYMHLSKISVNVGELVQQGQVIGQSGQTGYAEGPHLHLTVRINGISIDPLKFLEFFPQSTNGI